MISIPLPHAHANAEDTKIFKGNTVPSNGFGRRLRALTAAASSFINCVKSNVLRWNWLKLDSSARSCNQ